MDHPPPEGLQPGASNPLLPVGIPLGLQLTADMSLVTFFPEHWGHRIFSSDLERTSVSKQQSHLSQ